MRRILFLILLGIILVSCSGPQGENAGIINGQRITYPEFVRSYRGHTANFQLRAQRAPTNEERIAIFNETWENITKHVILTENYKKYDIKVTDQEVIDTLLTNIPPYLQDTPALKVNGEFDYDLYYQSIRYDSPVNMSPVRRHYYEYYIPIQKLKEELIDENVQKSRRAKRINEIAVSRADFDLLVFDPEDMTPVIGDNEIEAYYQRNMEQFALEPIYGVQYISIPVDPDESDQIYTQAVTDSIYIEIIQGKQFETIVSERQAYIPELNIFSSGFVRVENVDRQLLDILEYIPSDAYSKPIKVGNGYTIYQKLQRTKSMISYRALQIPPILSPATVNAQYSKAVGAIKLARKLGMEETARELDLEMIELNRLSLNDIWYPDLRVVERVNAQLYTHKKGDFIDPIYSNLSGSWIVFYLTENKVNRVRPLADVRDSILETLIEERKHHLAAQKAKEFINVHPDLKIPEEPGDYIHLRYNRGGIFSKYKDHSLDIAYVNAISRYLDNKPPQVDKIGDYYIIIIPREYYKNSKDKLEPGKLRELYVKQLDPDWFDQWMQERMDKAKIQIFVKP